MCLLPLSDCLKCHYQPKIILSSTKQIKLKTLKQLSERTSWSQTQDFFMTMISTGPPPNTAASLVSQTSLKFVSAVSESKTTQIHFSVTANIIFNNSYSLFGYKEEETESLLIEKCLVSAHSVRKITLTVLPGRTFSVLAHAGQKQA